MSFNKNLKKLKINQYTISYQSDATKDCYIFKLVALNWKENKIYVI